MLILSFLIRNTENQNNVHSSLDTIQEELCKYIFFCSSIVLKSCEILFDINFAFFALYHPFIFLRQMNANRRPLNISFSLWFLKSRNLKLSWIIVIKRHSHLTLYLFKYLCYFISKLLPCFSCFLLPHLLT